MPAPTPAAFTLVASASMAKSGNIQQPASASSATHAHLPAWRHFLRLIRPEASDVGLIVIYGAASAVFTLAVPLTVDALISNIIFGTLLAPLIVLVFVLLGCLLFHALLRGLQTYIGEVIERRIFVRVVGDLSWRLPQVDIQSFDNRYGPELVNRFFDTVTVQKSSSKLFLSVTNIVLSTAAGMLVLSFYHPFLLGFVLVMIAAVAFLVFGLGVGGVRTAVALSIAKYEVASWLQQLARHTTAFCTKGGADFARERANALAHNYVRARKRHFRIWFRQICGTLGLQVAASTAVLGIGGWLVIDQQLTPGQLVASELIVSAVVANITKLGEALTEWYDVCAASEKLAMLIDLPLERQDGAVLPPSEGGVNIELHAVSCGDSDATHAVEAFDLRIAAGERVALVGSVGGAGSRLFDVLFGLREPHSGYVTVEGLDLRQLRLDTTRDDFSLVHGTEIVEGTILENIQFGRMDLAPTQIRDALEAVALWNEILALPQGLNTPLTTRGQPLTGSQASRLMLARAIVRGPRLLLLDGALDVLGAAHRREIIRNLFDRKHKWTMLVLTHLEDVAAACDRIVDLEPVLMQSPSHAPERGGAEP